jgi:hypothetical protein
VDMYTCRKVHREDDGSSGMSKKPTLSAALQSLESRRPGPVSPDVAADRAAVEKGPSTQPPSRLGKKTIAGHFDPAVSRQLRALGLEHDRTVQDLLSEALNGLFEKYGKPPIA